MFYQLIHHDKAQSSTLIATSPDFRTIKEVEEWYQDETRHRVLPEGRFWGLIDEKHVAFRRQPESVSTELTFEQIMTIQKVAWQKEIEDNAAYEQRLADYMSKFPG
mgnify:FL=1